MKKHSNPARIPDRPLPGTPEAAILRVGPDGIRSGSFNRLPHHVELGPEANAISGTRWSSRKRRKTP